MKPRRGILVALDSVGIDPRGHDHAGSVYRESAFLFPGGRHGEILELPRAPIEGALVETDVAGESTGGAIECAITYTSIFTGRRFSPSSMVIQTPGSRRALRSRDLPSSAALTTTSINKKPRRFGFTTTRSG